jgi:hypothetical protein
MKSQIFAAINLPLPEGDVLSPGDVKRDGA